MKMRKNKGGITLVEVLAAITIMVFAAVAIMQFYLSSLALSEANKEGTIAMAHLTNMMETIECTPFSNILTDFPNGVPDGTINNNYATLVGGYILKDEHIIVSYVNPSSDPLEIIVSVNWQDRSKAARTKYLVTKSTR
jgi:type II secretory pathway pseudopilin PulG